MKAFIGACFLVVVAMVPAALHAESFDSGTVSGGYCPDLTLDLQRGDRDATKDGQVTRLQTFLVDFYDLNPDANISGFFGRLTQGNVIRFQRDHGLPAVGRVGPLTRAKIASVCAQPATISSNVQAQNMVIHCTFNGTAVLDGASVLAYKHASVPSGSICESEARVCSHGMLSGSFAHSSCVVQEQSTTSCTPLPAESQTIACPSGQVGSITQMRYSSCSAGGLVPTWGSWVTTVNTCAIPQTTSSPCSFNGQTIADGASVTAYEASSVTSPASCVSQVRACTNGVLSGNYSYGVCSVQQVTPTEPSISVSKLAPGHYGQVPVTVTLTFSSSQAENVTYDYYSNPVYRLAEYTQDWGVGTSYLPAADTYVKECSGGYIPGPGGPVYTPRTCTNSYKATRSFNNPNSYGYNEYHMLPFGTYTLKVLKTGGNILHTETYSTP